MSYCNTRSMSGVPDTTQTYMNERSLRRFFKDVKKRVAEYEADVFLLERDMNGFYRLNNSCPVVDNDLDDRFRRLIIRCDVLDVCDPSLKDYFTPERFARVVDDWINNWDHLEPLRKGHQIKRFFDNVLLQQTTEDDRFKVNCIISEFVNQEMIRFDYSVCRNGWISESDCDSYDGDYCDDPAW